MFLDSRHCLGWYESFVNDLLPSFHSFPGGKRDPEDNSIVDTAVREMEEELGLERSHVQVWAQMPVFPDRVSTFI